MPFSLLCILFSTNTVPYLTPIARLALYLRFSALYVPFSVPSVPFQPSMCLTQLRVCPFQSVMCLIYVDLQFGPLLFGIKHVRLIWKATRHRQIIRYRPEIQMAPMTLLAEFFVLFVVIITPPLPFPLIEYLSASFHFKARLKPSTRNFFYGKRVVDIYIYSQINNSNI